MHRQMAVCVCGLCGGSVGHNSFSLPQAEGLLQVCRRCFLGQQVVAWLTEPNDLSVETLEVADSFLEQIYLVLKSEKEEAARRQQAQR